MRTNKYILLAATLFGLSSCGNKRGDYDASGTFEATEVIVSSEANGKIMQFNIEEGQLLKAGEEVGCIDTLQLYLKKMQLRPLRNKIYYRGEYLHNQTIILYLLMPMPY